MGRDCFCKVMKLVTSWHSSNWCLGGCGGVRSMQDAHRSSRDTKQPKQRQAVFGGKWDFLSLVEDTCCVWSVVEWYNVTFDTQTQHCRWCGGWLGQGTGGLREEMWWRVFGCGDCVWVCGMWVVIGWWLVLKSVWCCWRWVRGGIGVIEQKFKVFFVPPGFPQLQLLTMDPCGQLSVFFTTGWPKCPEGMSKISHKPPHINFFAVRMSILGRKMEQQSKTKSPRNGFQARIARCGFGARGQVGGVSTLNVLRQCSKLCH